jgi:prolyl oligopeptidase
MTAASATAFATPASAASAAAPIPPLPETPRGAAVDMYHGERVADPYRWLEGSAAPEFVGDAAAADARVRSWALAQNAHTRAVLDAVAGRAALEQRLRELLATDSLSSPTVRGGRHFYFRRRGTESNAILFVRESETAPERELLNVNKLYPDGRTTLAWTSVAHDGSLVAFGLFKSGDENTTLRILETATGKWRGDVLTGKVGGVNWLPDGSAFVYRKLADIKNPYSGEIRFHRLGDAPAADRLVFAQYKTGPLAHTWGPTASLDRTGRWLLLTYHTGTASNDLYLCDFREWLASGELRRRVVSEGADALFHGAIREGKTLYLYTTAAAPRGRLLAADIADFLKNAPLANALPAASVNVNDASLAATFRNVAAEAPDAVLDGFSLAKDFLALTWKENALNRIEIRDPDGSRARPLALPGVGSPALHTDPETNTAYLSFSSFNIPPSIYRVALADGARSLYFRPAYAVDSDALVVEQHFFRASDGARVPLYLAYKKRAQRTQPAPTVLYGYGGFGIGIAPSFVAGVVPWLEAGGIYAVAGIRGGDEFGEPWHRAGMLAQKQRVFDDFADAAQWLIAHRYTTPAQLGIRGGSNGGLLTGAALVQHPDLYAAASVAVPLLDMLRYQHFLMARYWVPEYGDSARAADYRWLRAYSPYHHVKPGTAYPAVLLEAGENDTRVHALHARKFAAALQHATTSPPAQKPVLLWVDFDSGHGSGKSFDMQIRDTADVWLFFARQLGVKF